VASTQYCCCVAPIKIGIGKRASVQEVLGTKLARRPPPVNGEEIEKEGLTTILPLLICTESALFKDRWNAFHDGKIRSADSVRELCSLPFVIFSF
jgi:hypothetical protein